MKLVVLALLAAVAVAVPQDDQRPVVELLSDEREHTEDGTFKYSFSTDNNINIAVTGIREPESGTIHMEGTFWMPTGDGQYKEVRFIANEFGYQPQSDLLPVAPPAPAHVAELLLIAEEQRAAGISFEANSAGVSVDAPQASVDVSADAAGVAVEADLGIL